VVGSAVARDGTIVTDWASTFGTIAHVGLDPAVPNAELQGPCCGYQTAVAADEETGDVYAAWCSNAKDAEGTYVQKVKPSGPKLRAPGSVTTFGGQPVAASTLRVRTRPRPASARRSRWHRHLRPTRSSRRPATDRSALSTS
jgi:hypothetical protein